MPRRHSITDTEQPTTTLRRSPRLRCREAGEESDNVKFHTPRSKKVRSPDLSLSSTRDVRAKENCEDCRENLVKKSSNGHGNRDKCVTGLRKSPRLNKEVEEIQILRRSPRFSNRLSSDQQNEKTGEDKSAGKYLCEEIVEKKERRIRRNVVGSEAAMVEKERKGRNGSKGSEESGVKRKRKQGEEENAVNQGWTEEQEAALQRAYFAAKPTPHFWKKVSKLVPGKSAQDCFDKVNSDHLTPPHPRPRSRANRTGVSSLGSLSLSASKLLETTKKKGKLPCFNKRKSHYAQKTARHLLQKHYFVGQEIEVDLFSVLEPDSNQAFQPNVILSTPKNYQGKPGILQKCCEKSSSGHKKPTSRFSSLCGPALVSPPVLKQVKNQVLHEKYIDQLHCREAKRRAASARTEKLLTREEDKKEGYSQNIDAVRAAKSALVSDARDAITRLQHLQASTMSNSFKFDDHIIDSDDDKGKEDACT